MTKAEEIARYTHYLQKDKTGAPYILHPERVAAAVAHLGPDYEAAGWLHDVIEDGAETCTTLADAINPTVARAVWIVSRKQDETYREFINRILDSGDPIAIAVKLADLNGNLRPGVGGLRQRYEEAILRLQAVQAEMRVPKIYIARQP